MSTDGKKDRSIPAASLLFKLKHHFSQAPQHAGSLHCSITRACCISLHAVKSLLRLLLQNSAFTDHLEAAHRSKAHLEGLFRSEIKLECQSAYAQQVLGKNKPCPCSNKSEKCLQMPSTCMFITTSASTWSAEGSSSHDCLSLGSDECAKAEIESSHALLVIEVHCLHCSIPKSIWHCHESCRKRQLSNLNEKPAAQLKIMMRCCPAL